MTIGRVEVTSADIARLAGVKPAAVSNWRRRHDDFPAPVGGTERSPRFDLTEIEQWLAARGAGEAIDPQRRLLQAFDTARDASSANQALGTVGLLLLQLHRHPDTVVPSTVGDLSALLTDAESAFSAHKPSGPGVADMASRRPQPDLTARMRSLLADAADAAARTGAAPVFETLLRHEESTAGPAARPLPRELGELMVALAGAPAGELVDPACGRGQILLAAAYRGWRRVRAQERDSANAWAAALRLAFAAQETDVRHSDVHAEDALRTPVYPLGRADTVVFAPPVGDRNWGLQDLEHDSRWIYGVPPRLESELAWLQHALAHVRPEGRIVALMPPAVAERASGRRIRRELVRTGTLRAVVGLPAGLAAYHSLPLHLWILTRPDQALTDTAEPILFLDTEHKGAPRDHNEWAALSEQITGVWEEFRADPHGFAERPGRARAVSPLDLIGGTVDLTPRSHLPLRCSPQESQMRMEWMRAEVLRLLTELREAVTSLPATSAPDEAPARFVTVEELAERGTVTVRRPPPAPASEDGRPPITDGTDTDRVLTADDLITGAPPSGSEPADTDPMRNPPIRAGDVLVPAMARRPLARVVGKEEDGAYPGPNIYVLRPDDLAVDPWYLAGVLSSGEGERQIARTGSHPRRTLRIDPRRLRLPVLPIEIQHYYGEQFRRLARLTELLRSLQQRGDDLVDAANTLLTGPLIGTGESTLSAR